MAETTTKEKKAKPVKYDYTYAVGRRKTSSARVRFYASAEKQGEVTVNEQKLEEYFPAVGAAVVKEIFSVISAPVDGYFTVKVKGGGIHSQAGAVRHGIARVLVKLDEDLRPILRQKGFMTRDPRMKERKKPGLRGARRAPQWSKR